MKKKVAFQEGWSLWSETIYWKFIISVDLKSSPIRRVVFEVIGLIRKRTIIQIYLRLLFTTCGSQKYHPKGLP
jgi:hypothetical protein